MAMSKSTADSISSYARVLAQALNERDDYTRRHCDRVIELAGSFGRACGLVNGDLHTLRLCGRFHDIGKIGIPDHVLRKPGRLDAADWELMRSHPERGERIVAAINVDGVADIARGVRHHHEHFDGGGYPDGLAGEDIPYISRMIAIVDGYDAMAADRPYHPGRKHDEIMAIMRGEAGSKYDPYLLERFAAMIEDSNRKAPAA